MDMQKIGFIGFGNHAARLNDCLKEILGEYKFISYHPNKENKQTINDFNALKECDAIFITSPNHTHFKYLNEVLYKTKAKIFCEKPPCNNLLELKKLEILDPESKSRIFFNFNYRYSKLCQLIQASIVDKLIGNVIHVNGLISHGLAFKDGYEKSWRGKYPINKSVVLDTSLIHLVDLCNYLFGGSVDIKYSTGSSIKHGLDSFYINLESKNKVNISLFGSYAAPYYFSLKIFGSDGFIEVNDKSLVLRRPRDTFDEQGLFTIPPKYIDDNYSFELDYQNSLQSAVNYFISKCKIGENFSSYDFDLSIETTKIILDAQKDD